ncbi:hypothetical protein QOT17_000314 [Balamuthia mandrillaris]
MEGGESPNVPSLGSASAAAPPTASYNRSDLRADFLELLLTIEEDNPSGELFSFLFDLLVEYSLLAEDREKSSSELDFFNVFFTFIPKCAVSLQIVLLHRLHGLVASLTRVKAYCLKERWTERLLQLLFLPHFHPAKEPPSMPMPFSSSTQPSLPVVSSRHQHHSSSSSSSSSSPLHLATASALIQSNPSMLAEVLQLVEVLGTYSFSTVELKSLFRGLSALLLQSERAVVKQTKTVKKARTFAKGTASNTHKKKIVGMREKKLLICSLLQTFDRILQQRYDMERSTPAFYWDFNGRDSGLKLPTDMDVILSTSPHSLYSLSNQTASSTSPAPQASPSLASSTSSAYTSATWSLHSHYSFCTWLNISSFQEPSLGFLSKSGTHPIQAYLGRTGRQQQPQQSQHPQHKLRPSIEHTGQGSYKPHLFSFIGEDGRGVEAFFQNHRLTVQTVQSKGKVARVVFSFMFQPSTWYFITVTHVYRFLRRSEVSLYINGEPVERQPLSYPKIERFPVSFSIASNFIGDSQSIRQQQCELTQPLFGQMGQVLIVQGLLSDLEVQGLYSLGPNMNPKHAFGVATITGQKGSYLYFNGKRCPYKLLYSYDPKGCASHLVVDSCTHSNDRYALVLPGTATHRTSHAGDSLFCAGGVKVLLFLLYQLAHSAILDKTYPDPPSEVRQTPEPSPKLSSHQQQKSTNKPTSSCCDFSDSPLAMLIALVVRAMRGSRDLQREMREMDGWRVLGKILEHIRPYLWNKASLSALDMLAQYLWQEDKLQFQIYFTSTYLNFTAWKNCHMNAQAELVSQITNFVKKHPSYFRQLVGVQRVADALCYFHLPSLRLSLLQLIGTDILNFHQTVVSLTTS